jgi:hypothetical protein
VHQRGLVSSVGLGWTLVPSIGFAASEERDGALERGTGVGLEREEPALGWRERNRRWAGERDGAPERPGRRC